MPQTPPFFHQMHSIPVRIQWCMKNSTFNCKPLIKNNNGRSAPLAKQDNAIYIAIPRMTNVIKTDIPRNLESGVTENRRVATVRMQNVAESL